MSDVSVVDLVKPLVSRIKDKTPPITHRKRKKSGYKPMSLLLWTTIRRPLLKKSALFDLDDHGYLVDLYNCRNRVVVVKKAGQIGVSELLVSYAFWSCDERGMDVLYIMPTGTDVSDFSRTRFAPALEASPYINRLVRPPLAERKKGLTDYRGADKVTLKRVGDNWLYFRGGVVKADGSAPQLKSVPVDAIIFDERDEIDDQAVPIAKKRYGHSPIKEEWYVSTPSYSGAGIDRHWEESDQREWFVPCPHCGKRQQLLYKRIIIEEDDFGRPVEWYGKSEDRAYVPCKKCGKELNRLAKGEWVPRRFGRNVAGFHPTKLMSPHTPLIDIVKDFITLDDTERREATNQHLGLAYTPRGGKLTNDIILQNKKDYAHGPPSKGVRTFVGIDVSPYGLNIIVREKTDDGSYRQLLAVEVPTFDQADGIVRKYNAGCVVCDALPELTQARAFQNSFRVGLVWLAYFSGSDKGTKKLDPIGWNKDDAVVNLDRTRVIDSMYARFYNGLNWLPLNISSVENYEEQMKAPTRVTIQKPNGEHVSVYKETGDDHYALAETYCYVASTRSVWWVS